MEMLNALKNNDLELFCKLVHGENVNTPDANGVSPVRIAVSFGRVDFVEYLIKIGANVNCATDVWWPPLLKASYDGNIVIAKILIEAGADVNYQTKDGVTALRWVIDHDSYEMVKLLINHGASMPDRSNHHTKVPERITKYIANRTALNQSIILILTLHKQKLNQSPVWFIKQDKNVIKMIGKHLWSLRMLEQ
jgi:ankyrin repeat protein